MKNVFFTTTVHVSSWPYKKVKNDPIELHRQNEAIAKVHRFCHQIYKVPVTWIVSWGGLQKYGATLKGFCDTFGDEVGIMEYGIYPQNVLDGDASCQHWVEELGIPRPDAFAASEPELVGTESWNDMPYQKQKTCISYLKKAYENVLGRPVTTFAAPFINGDTVRVLKEEGFTCVWGYNWNYFCEGINNKGCPFVPFYPSALNHNLPEKEEKACTLLATHWGISPYSVWNYCESHSRRTPAWCLNSMELANRSLGLNNVDYDRTVIRERASQIEYNSYVHLPLQLETVWMDEEDISAYGLPEQYPSYNPHSAENFYKQIEECLRLGAVPVTQRALAQWHKANVGPSGCAVTYSEDPVPEVEGNGKDRHIPPFMAYADKDHQYWFSRDRGMNYIRKYTYTEQNARANDGEFPFENEPDVYIKIKHSVTLHSGVCISDGGAYYEAGGLELTAYREYPDYAGAIWQLNLPAYVREQDIAVRNIKDFKLLRSKNAAIFFADLQKGDNELVFRSDLPGQFIRICRKERVGRRYEIWLENTGEEAKFCRLQTVIDKNLRLGGFWWDGVYRRNLFCYDFGGYNAETGEFCFSVGYPQSLRLNRGYTRLTLELL